MKKTKLLSYEQEIDLATIIQKGRASTATPTEKHAASRAAKKLIDGNAQLVQVIADKFLVILCEKYPFLQNTEPGAILDDLQTNLIKAGMKGVRKALDHYDPTRGYKFSTYSTWWIRQAMNEQSEEWTRFFNIVKIMYEHKDKTPVKAD